MKGGNDFLEGGIQLSGYPPTLNLNNDKRTYLGW